MAFATRLLRVRSGLSGLPQFSPDRCATAQSKGNPAGDVLRWSPWFGALLWATMN